MKKVILTGMTAPVAEKQRIDGKVSRLFTTVSFAEAIEGKNGELTANPFRTCSRNIWQQHSADGKTANWRQTPAQLQALISNKLAIPGSIESHSVEKYPVVGPDGKQNKTKDGQLVFADRYTAVVLGGEDVARVYKAANHILAEGSPAPAKKVEAELQA